MRFKVFFESEEQKDIEKTLSKLPPSHAQLVRGFKWNFQIGNTLHGDDKHVGCLDQQQGLITVAAPWNYPREFAVLHEIGHQVWSRLNPDIHHQWTNLAHQAGSKEFRDPEESFCMFYANHFVKNKMTKFDHAGLDHFIDRLPEITS